jgi:hypothetical protein
MWAQAKLWLETGIAVAEPDAAEMAPPDIVPTTNP